MVRLQDLQVGDKVHYQPAHYLKNDEFEHGIVKEIPEFNLSHVRVVFNCNGEWDNYRDYTAHLTNVADLNKGWRTDKEPKNKQ